MIYCYLLIVPLGGDFGRKGEIFVEQLFRHSFGKLIPPENYLHERYYSKGNKDLEFSVTVFSGTGIHNDLLLFVNCARWRRLWKERRNFRRTIVSSFIW